MPTRSSRRSRPKDPVSKTPQLQYSILCNSVQQIPQTGMSLIVGPFDTITRTGDTPQPLSCVILDCWTNGVGHFSEYVEIKDPLGHEVLQTPEIQFWLPDSFHRHSVHHNISLALSEPGMHTVHVYLNNQQVIEYKVKFDVRPSPTTPAP